MTHKKRWLTVIVLCGVIFSGVLHKTYITEEEVHRLIQSEIPPGSTLDQVADFLRKHDWGRSEPKEFTDWGALLIAC